MTTEIKLPPHDPKAERELLAVALRMMEIPTIPPDRFYTKAHRLVAQAIEANSLAGHEMGAVEIIDRLIDMGMDKIDAYDIVTDLDSMQPSLGSWDYLHQKLEGLHSLREAIRVCAETEAAATRPGAVPSQVLDELQSQVLGIGISEKASGSTMSDLTKEIGIDVIGKALDSDRPQTGMMTGIPFLDKSTGGLRGGQLVVIGARPSQGKSALALDLIMEFCRAGHRTSLFSIEMTKREIFVRYLAKLTGIPMTAWECGQRPASHDALGSASQKLREWPLKVYDEDIDTDSKVIRIARRDRPDVVVVDYLQLMTSASTESKRHLALGNITRALKVYSKTGALVILLSQINREADKRDDPCPRLGELKDSGSVEQDADLVLFPFFPKNAETLDMQPAKLCIAKHRNGPTGIADMVFDRKRCAFREASRYGYDGE